MKRSRRRHHNSILFGIAALAVIALIAFAAGGRMKPAKPLPRGVKADRIVIEKARRRLILMRKGKALKSYRVALGKNPRGPKTRRGDGRTPEGLYRIDWRNPESRYHLSLHISYPGRKDRARARKLGVSPGGAIMIHGLPNGLGWLGRLHARMDWTGGCIAVSDPEIEEIWRAVPVGTAVEIRP